jgi:hypothetical protein
MSWTSLEGVYQEGRRLQAAVDLARLGEVTWLNEDGRNVAAVVPVEVAQAWITAREDLEEIARVTGRLRDLVQVYDRAQAAGSEVGS